MNCERPQGVRVIRADGSVIPCELAWVGIDEDGMAEWEISTTVNFRQGDSLKVATLPPRTSIIMPTGDVDDA